MVLVFHPTDEGFKHNLRQIRQATISKKHASSFLNVIIEGKAHDATTAHVRPDGWFAYSNEYGENRVELDKVTAVQVYYIN